MNRPIVKIALLISIIVMGGYTFLVNMDVQDYQEVHSICSKAVKGFPADKLAPLARSGKLQIETTTNGVSMFNKACSCNIDTQGSTVSVNYGTSCKQT